MWTYVQRTGDFFRDGKYIQTGYSGRVPDGKNDPSKECEKNVGPIPRGYFKIGLERQTPTVISFPLEADNPAYCTPRRDGFLIHGDNSTSTASTGCIILSRTVRELIKSTDDRRLRVVENSTHVQSITNRLIASTEIALES